MKTKITSSSFLLLTFCLMLFSSKSRAATADVLITVTNIIQTTPNTFEYDIFLTNTGTTDLKLRGYMWGLNLTPGIENGGTITHAFINRDTAFANLLPVIPAYTPSMYHIRATTLNAAMGNEVALTANVPYKLARMSVHTTASCWLPNFNPFTPVSSTPIQVFTSAGISECRMTAIVTPPNSTYTIYGTANPATTTSIPGLTAMMIPDPAGAAPFLLNCACSFYDTVTAKACGASFTWPVNGQTYTVSGAYSNTITTVGSCDSVTVLNLLLTTLDTTTTLNGFIISSNATGVSYQWVDCGSGLPVSAANSQTFTPAVSGDYAVILSTPDCIDTSLCVNVGAVGLHEAGEPDLIQLYPNPGSGLFTIVLKDISRISIYNGIGELVINETLAVGKHTLNMMKLAYGIYSVRIISTKGLTTMRLIKQD